MTTEQPTPDALPPPETWYCFKELLDTDSGRRLITPWADPFVYEERFDYIFTTEQEALDAKESMAPDENWVLVKETLEPIAVVPAEVTSDES